MKRRLFNLAAAVSLTTLLVITAMSCTATPDAEHRTATETAHRAASEIRRAGIAFTLPEGFRHVSTSWENRKWARQASPDGASSATLLFSIQGRNLSRAKRLHTSLLRQRAISPEAVGWRRRRGWPEVLSTELLALRTQDRKVVTQLTALIRSDDGTVLSLHLMFDEAHVTPANADAALRLIDSIRVVGNDDEAVPAHAAGSKGSADS